ncbi:hypothetical protein CBR_g33914 [Chara braunii]|uniref:Uncharacterized protein n=1 Tax=Chara braunii TaxID=69332 RepID=A0A388LHL3_CHABU|nr:hypothetical protein CBR_g33914 [Chara braunii]|eukprot:GBG81735.1 hypothetical protein CBR_g33914 [Chara braunii]
MNGRPTSSRGGWHAPATSSTISQSNHRDGKSLPAQASRIRGGGGGGGALERWEYEGKKDAESIDALSQKLNRLRATYCSQGERSSPFLPLIDHHPFFPLCLPKDGAAATLSHSLVDGPSNSTLEAANYHARREKILASMRLTAGAWRGSADEPPDAQASEPFSGLVVGGRRTPSRWPPTEEDNHSRRDIMIKERRLSHSSSQLAGTISIRRRRGEEPSTLFGGGRQMLDPEGGEAQPLESGRAGQLRRRQMLDPLGGEAQLESGRARQRLQCADAYRRGRGGALEDPVDAGRPFVGLRFPRPQQEEGQTRSERTLRLLSAGALATADAERRACSSILGHDDTGDLHVAAGGVGSRRHCRQSHSFHFQLTEQKAVSHQSRFDLVSGDIVTSGSPGILSGGASAVAFSAAARRATVACSPETAGAAAAAVEEADELAFGMCGGGGTQNDLGDTVSGHNDWTFVTPLDRWLREENKQLSERVSIIQEKYQEVLQERRQLNEKLKKSMAETECLATNSKKIQALWQLQSSRDNQNLKLAKEELREKDRKICSLALKIDRQQAVIKSMQDELSGCSQRIMQLEKDRDEALIHRQRALADVHQLHKELSVREEQWRNEMQRQATEAQSAHLVLKRKLQAKERDAEHLQTELSTALQAKQDAETRWKRASEALSDALFYENELMQQRESELARALAEEQGKNKFLIHECRKLRGMAHGHTASQSINHGVSEDFELDPCFHVTSQ